MVDTLEKMSDTINDLDTLMPDNRESAHQLIILGNGFDLACGLPSSYADFFKGVAQKIFPNPTSLAHKPWGEYLRSHGFTAWDVILCNKAAKTDWYDVEDEIERWVCKHSVMNISRIERIARLLSGSEASIPGWDTLPANWMEYVGGPLENYPEADVARYLIDTNPEMIGKHWLEKDISSILLNELHILEARFMTYLTHAIHEREDYASCATELLSVLEESRSLPDYYRYWVSVLNFNYTMPYQYDARMLPYETQTVNIHGCLEDENAIFGIDGSDCLDNTVALPFTKTYRIMGEGTGDVADIVFSPDSSFGRATSIIKFFGHSLSVADYSYFQAVFDAVDLYGGSTMLVFYYRPYEPEDVRGTKAREETMKRVTHLLSEYGKTLDNKDHGKNLVHRLLIEGRLHVQRI